MKKCKILFSSDSIDLQEYVEKFFETITGDAKIHNSQDENYYYACILYEDEPEEEKKTTRYFSCELTEEQFQNFRMEFLEKICVHNFKEINEKYIDINEKIGSKK